MNSRYVEGLEKGIAERSELMAKKFKEQFDGMGPTITNTRGDREFLLWFLKNLNEQGPDWVTHLEFVAGGKEVLQRERRLREQYGPAGLAMLIRGMSDGAN